MDLEKFQINGQFLMLALDHRGSFKKLINPQDSEAITEEEIVALKFAIIESVKSQMSGVLIDVDYGLKAYSGRTKPFLLPLEKSGYGEVDGERVTDLEHTALQLKELGADGAKLLLYFNPHLSSSKKQIEVVKQAVADSKNKNLPFFLEVVTYVVNGKIEEQREQLVLDSLKVFKELGIAPDVWKLEYPGSLEGCQKITESVGATPWILLTRGDSFEKFVPELEDAVRSGCRGFLAGRALWQEVCSLQGEEKEKFLSEILPDRFRKIVEIANFKS